MGLLHETPGVCPSYVKARQAVAWRSVERPEIAVSQGFVECTRSMDTYTLMDDPEGIIQLLTIDCLRVIKMKRPDIKPNHNYVLRVRLEESEDE